MQGSMSSVQPELQLAVRVAEVQAGHPTERIAVTRLALVDDPVSALGLAGGGRAPSPHHQQSEPSRVRREWRALDAVGEFRDFGTFGGSLALHLH